MAVKKAKPKRAEATAAGAGFFMYIGPTIRGLIQSNTIYIGTRAEALKAAAAAIEHAPLVETLIVPGETLAADRIKLKTPGTAVYLNYRRVLRGK